MNRLIRLAAVILPVLGLGALWVQSDRTYHQGTEWEVPIAGYDPRDVLRGHYVEFVYDWPGRERWAIDAPQALCLEGAPPRIAKVAPHPEGAPCAHPLRTATTSVYGWEGLLRGRAVRRGAAAARRRREGSPPR